MKKKPTYRKDRVAQVLTQALIKVLDENRGFIDLPLLTINHISMSSDLKKADVFFSFFATDIDEENYEERIEEILNSYSKIIRRELARLVYLKSIPELRFHYDALLQSGNKIINLIESTKH